MPISRLRSLLYAPANRPDLIAKMERFAPDGVIIDLEDGTPPAEKIAARVTAFDAATALRSMFAGSLWLRVNAPASELIEGDIKSIAGGAFDGIVVPKIEHPEDVTRIEHRLTDVAGQAVRIMWGFESVLGVHNCDRILARSEHTVAAFFGAEDYIADLGGRRTLASLETLYPRSQVAIACRLRGITAIDQVVLALDDHDHFRRDALDGVGLGYRGKNCIHPSQVSLCAEVYTPTAAEISRAQRLLLVYEQAIAEGRGTANFEGQMIDTPLVTQAKTVLALSDDR